MLCRSSDVIQMTTQEPGRTLDLTQRWPNEILINVFMFAHSGVYDILSLSWVCMRWRRAIIAYKQFWGDVEDRKSVV